MKNSTGHGVSRKRGRTAAIAAAAALGLLLSACTGGSSGGSSASSSKVLRIGIGTEALPDPAKATVSGLWAATVYDLAYEPLIHLDTEGELKPALAESWGYVKDSKVPNTVFELKLRTGAKFSDGAPVDADAVVTWLKYFIKAGGAFAGALGTDPVITATDATTVRVELTAPNPSLGVTFSDAGPNIGFVASPKAVANPALFAKGTYGAGPYVLDAGNSVTGDHYSYKPNPTYFEKSAVKFSEVDVKVIAQASSRLQAQQSGQLDVAFGDLTTADAASKVKLKVLTVAQGVVAYTFDLLNEKQQPVLKDVRVRQAIAHAIDRKKLASTLLDGRADPASSPLFSDTDTGLNDYWTYDPALSKKLLAEAGFKDGFSFDALVQGPYKGLTGEPLMRAVAQQLKAVGITMKITSYTTDAAYAKDVFGKVAPMFELVPTVSTVPTYYGSWLAKGGALNFFGQDTAVDKLYTEGATASDPKEAWTQMMKEFVDKAYMIPVVTDPTLYYVSDKVEGVKVSTAHKTALPTEWQFKN